MFPWFEDFVHESICTTKLQVMSVFTRSLSIILLLCAESPDIVTMLSASAPKDHPSKIVSHAFVEGLLKCMCGVIFGKYFGKLSPCFEH